MSILEHNSIDMIGWDESKDRPVLGIADHLTWDDFNEHLRELTMKVDTYVQFVNSGQLREKYPQYSGGPIEFRLHPKYAMPKNVLIFFSDLKKKVSQLNSNISIDIRSDSDPDK